MENPEIKSVLRLAIDVDCPFCKAGRGFRCQTTGGYDAPTHNARWTSVGISDWDSTNIHLLRANEDAAKKYASARYEARRQAGIESTRQADEFAREWATSSGRNAKKEGKARIDNPHFCNCAVHAEFAKTRQSI